MFLARIRCPWCDGDNAHRVCHDDLTPPDPSIVWAYYCPTRRRLVLVDARTTEWTRHRPPLLGPEPQSLLDLLPREPA